MRESIIVLVQIADAHRISPGMVRVLATPRFEIIKAYDVLARAPLRDGHRLLFGNGWFELSRMIECGRFVRPPWETSDLITLIGLECLFCFSLDGDRLDLTALYSDVEVDLYNLRMAAERQRRDGIAQARDWATANAPFLRLKDTPDVLN
jgi:hypothetical protein